MPYYRSYRNRSYVRKYRPIASKTKYSQETKAFRLASTDYTVANSLNQRTYTMAQNIG